MEYARDMFTKALVHAEIARRAHGYLCPNCGKRVVLRRETRFRRAAFAHWPGEGTEACEYYFPGKVSGRQSTTRWNLSLYVSLLDPSEARQMWNLELLLPESPDSAGHVRIEEGQSGPVSVPLTLLTRGGKRIPVRPLTQYQAITSPEVCPEYALRLCSPFQGLHKRRMNVFRFSLAGGRRLPESAPVIWGRSYFVIWHQTCAIDWWPKHMWHQPLESRGEWLGEVIELPVDDDPQVVGWLDHYLQRDVQRPPTMLSLVAPAEVERLQDETLLIPQSDEVLIGVTGENGAQAPEEVTIEDSEFTQVKIRLGGNLPILLSLTHVPAGRLDLWLSGSDEPDLCLLVTEHASYKRLPPRGIELTLEDSETGEQHVVPLFDEQLGDMLEQVRLGRLNLASVYIPQGVSGVIRTRQDSNSPWSEKPLALATSIRQTLPNYNQEFAESVERDLCAALSDRLLHIQIEFGNLGHVFVHGEAPSGTTKRLRLPWGVHSRLKWLLTLPQHPYGRRASGEALYYLRQDLVIGALYQFPRDEAALVQNVLDRAHWPAAAEPALRTVASAIRAALGLCQSKWRP